MCFRFRLAVHAVVTFPFFDTLIMIIIVLSSIALAAEDPVEERSARNKILTYFDYIFTSIFAVEMVLKVEIISKRRSTWNIKVKVWLFVLVVPSYPEMGIYRVSQKEGVFGNNEGFKELK